MLNIPRPRQGSELYSVSRNSTPPSKERREYTVYFTYSRPIPSTGWTRRNDGSPSGDLDKNRGRWRWGRRGVWTERSGVLSKKMKRPPSLSLPRLDRDPVSVKITPPLIREGSHLDRGDFRPFCMASSAVCAAVSLSSENKEMSDDQKEVWDSDDGTPDFPGVGVWIPLRVPKQELESDESIPLRNKLL